MHRYWRIILLFGRGRRSRLRKLRENSRFGRFRTDIRARKNDVFNPIDNGIAVDNLWRCLQL